MTPREVRDVVKKYLKKEATWDEVRDAVSSAEFVKAEIDVYGADSVADPETFKDNVPLLGLTRDEITELYGLAKFKE